MTDDWEEDGNWTDDSDEASDTIACSNCGADIYEDAEQCPVCHEYVTSSHSAWESKPTWWIVLGLLGIFAVIIVLSGF